MLVFQFLECALESVAVILMVVSMIAGDGKCLSKTLMFGF